MLTNQRTHTDDDCSFQLENRTRQTRILCSCRLTAILCFSSSSNAPSFSSFPPPACASFSLIIHPFCFSLQDSSGMRLWKRKWFVLADYCLFYYKGENVFCVMSTGLSTHTSSLLFLLPQHSFTHVGPHVRPLLSAYGAHTHYCQYGSQ